MNNNTDTGDTVTSTISVDNKTPQIREDLINTAVTFLLNPKVKTSPLNQKQQFLRSKGLTEDEIQLACERAGVFTSDPNNKDSKINFNIGNQTEPKVPNRFYAVQQQQQTIFGKIKEYLTTAALISGLTYAIYLFYKRFIEPLLFGRKKKKSVDEYLDEINSKVEDNYKSLNNELTSIQKDVKLTLENDKLFREVQNFKQDLDAIKGLLLNSKQFSKPSSVIPSSVPAWQLKNAAAQQERKTSENSEHELKCDETDSGSGSSETEVVKVDPADW